MMASVSEVSDYILPPPLLVEILRLERLLLKILGWGGTTGKSESPVPRCVEVPFQNTAGALLV